jgi:hypothetical protein
MVNVWLLTFDEFIVCLVRIGIVDVINRLPICVVTVDIAMGSADLLISPGLIRRQRMVNVWGLTFDEFVVRLVGIVDGNLLTICVVTVDIAMGSEALIQ